MSRVAFGKLPATTLKPITDKSIINHYGDIVDLLRVCRLMSMAEMAAALAKPLPVNRRRSFSGFTTMPFGWPLILI